MDVPTTCTAGSPMRYNPAMTGGVPLTPNSPAMAPEMMPKVMPPTVLPQVRGGCCRRGSGVSTCSVPGAEQHWNAQDDHEDAEESSHEGGGNHARCDGAEQRTDDPAATKGQTQGDVQVALAVVADRTEGGSWDDRGKGCGNGILRRHMEDECQQGYIEETATATKHGHQKTDGKADQDQRQDPPQGEVNGHSFWSHLLHSS